jgi:hypothetical protein
MCPAWNCSAGLLGGAHVHPHGLALVHHLDRFAGADGAAGAALAQRRPGQHRAGHHGDSDDEEVVLVKQKVQKVHEAS